MLILSILSSILLSCSSDELNNELPQCTEQEQQAFVDREVIATFTDVKGTVDGDVCGTFVLTESLMMDGTTFYPNLFACNLPDSFKKNGLEVIYSGQLFEIFDFENRCSRFFLLTKIDAQ